MNQQIVMSAPSAVRYLDLPSVKALYQLCAKKRIPYRKRGRSLVFIRSELDAHVRSLAVGASLAETRGEQEAA